MGLRDTLKRKMPATFNAAEYETDRVLDRLDELLKTLLAAGVERQISIENCVEAMRETFEHQTAELEKQAQKLKRLEEIVCAQIKKLDARMSQEDSHKILYHCPHEVRAIRDGGFYEFRKQEDYPARYLALIKGLDDESVHTVERILCRHLLVYGKENERLDLFTEEEKQEISRLYAEFYTQILPLREGLYTWGGALFPYPRAGMGWTETTVFLDCCGFGKVCFPKYTRDKCILDIGAFAGDSAIAFSPLTEERVYAFEASPANYKLLCKTVAVNKLENVVPVLSAVGAQAGTVIVPARLSMGNSLVAENKQEDTVEVEMISIDNFVREHRLVVGMIKVDIEGMEMQFLKGAEQTIRSQRPILLLSIYHTAEDFFGIKPLLESWDLNYHFSIHKEKNEHIHYDTMLVAEAF